MNYTVATQAQSSLPQVHAHGTWHTHHRLVDEGCPIISLHRLALQHRLQWLSVHEVSQEKQRLLVICWQIFRTSLL